MIPSSCAFRLSFVFGVEKRGFTSAAKKGFSQQPWFYLLGRQFSSEVKGEVLSGVRLSKLISQYATNFTMSRRRAESLIRDGEVTVAGEVVQSPQRLLQWKDLDGGNVILKIGGKPVLLGALSESSGKELLKPKVWAVHKLSGEVVTENDPQNRPSMIKRLFEGGVGSSKGRKYHLKPIGRLDMPTEGLILVTNDGEYARQMELPSNKLHRIYRARVHGKLTSYKLDRIRKGKVHSYSPMDVKVENTRRHSGSGRNTWLRITCTEGKNRQIRNAFEALGMTVARLIRISYGDYELQNIPPGMVVEVPFKPLLTQRKKGPMVKRDSHIRQGKNNPRIATHS